MTAPSFTQSPNAAELYWLDGGNWPPAGGFALILPAGSGAPTSLSLSQSFVQYPGTYVTIASRPAASDEPAFVAAVNALAQRLGAAARFFWLAAAAPDQDWGRRVLYLRQVAGAATALIDRPSVMALGRYRFSISAGQTLGLTADGFSIDGTVTPAFQLVTDDKTWPMANAGAGQTVLSADGALAGTFGLLISLDATANPEGIGDYELLDVGFRYGMADAADPNGILLTSLGQKLFRGVAAVPVPMMLQLDPCGVTEPGRTHFAYRGTVAAMATHYTAQLGYGVSLAPASGGGGLPAGLAFHRRPMSHAGTPADDPLYLAPIGPFVMSVASGTETAPAARLTGGLSGSEFFGFSAGDAVPISFVPGQAAFAAGFPPGIAATDGRATDQDGNLTDIATTAFAAIGPPAGEHAWYFAQPEGAAFFHVRAESPGGENLIPYLSLLDLVTTEIVTPGTPYPLTPYAGGGGEDLPLLRALERQILSPLRRAAIGAPGNTLMLPQSKREDSSVQGVTPQGILANFDGNVWSSLILCPSTLSDGLPQLAFNRPGNALRGALQSNQLFLVAVNGPLLLSSSDYNYWITDAVLGDLTRLSGSEAVPPDVVSLLSAQARAPQASLAAFTAMLDGVLTGSNAQYIPTVIKYGMYFELDIEGWRFRLSPSLWQDLVAHPPVMIFKYASGPLYDFVQNTDAWAWPEVAVRDGGSLADTQALINGIIAAAVADVAAQGTASDLSHFVNDIVNNPAWTGVVVLNANVPFSSVPEELSGLAAGVRPDEFRAHHVGLSQTPISVDTTTRDLSQQTSALFGLIDYQDPEDIAHIDGDFDFKVLLLRVLFVNSAIVNFAGRIEIFINRLFAEGVTLYDSEHYNNILIDGAYQRQGGSGHYVFVTSAVSVYGADSVGRGGTPPQTVLLQTEFDQVQFVTATANTSTSTVVRNRFLISGKLRFAALSGFDAFSFGPTLDRNGITVADGYLAFSGASIDMAFPAASPSQRNFVFSLDEIAFDPGASLARATSFIQRFPLQIVGMIAGAAGQRPRDLGYLPLETPLVQPAFTGPWFGLVLAVDLGTMGALASSGALSASILAAWSPSPRGHQANIGLKLPGVESARALAPIQGVIDIGFQAIDLQAEGAQATPPDPAYTMRLRNFYLRFLGWKFPPGQNVITMFGNPDVSGQKLSGDRDALGWYAAYQKKE